MLALRDLEQAFWQALVTAPGHSSAAPALLDCLPASPTQSASERLQVYVDAYFWRLHDVLQDTFEKTAAMVGTEQFTELARDYLAAFPSQHPSISYVGRDFARFLDCRSDVPEWAADLARLEWARAEVFEAADATPIGVDALRQLAPSAWGDVRFTTVAGLQLLDSAWAVHDVWEEPRAIAVAHQPTALRIWRAPDYRVLHVAMQPRHATALRRLCAGEPFPMICEVFADLHEDDAAQEAMGQLLRWVEDGLIAAVATSDTAGD